MSNVRTQIEHEVKLASRANLQMKYSVIDKPEIFRNKFLALLQILGIAAKQIKNYELQDEYYDDEKQSLRKAGLSLRVRSGEYPQHLLLTLKFPDRTRNGVGLKRKEKELKCTRTESLRYINDLSLLCKRFRLHLGSATSGIGRYLKPILTIKNKRLAIDFRTKAGNWQVCYDLFYFFSPNDGFFSPLSSEVEIEHLGSSSPQDPSITRIEKGLVDLFGLVRHKQPKLDRGLAFIAQPGPECKSVQTIGFDIVGYSLRVEEVQLQIIQKLNKFVRDAVHELGIHDFPFIYIPTGDGMFAVTEITDDKLLRLVVSVQHKTKEHNRTAPKELVFQFRSAIHSGPVFRFSDVNGNLNYAGNGINIAARVLGFGAEWHILASKAAYALIGTKTGFAECFHNAGILTAKHGVEIDVFNVFDESKQFGNPVAPEK